VAPAAAPASPAAQLAVRILPLRHEPDGTHRLTVHLHPVDLGPVSLVAEVRDGAIRMQLTGATEMAHHALREALPELRQELAQAGFRDCSLDLRQQAPGSGPGQQWTAPGRGRHAADSPPEQPNTPEPPAARRDGRASQLDLHV
jgi:flagellar hook-length control protein FliK